MDDFLKATWYVLEDPQVPGEYLILESLGQKLTAIWLNQDEARAFMAKTPSAAGMQVEKLEGYALKETYLAALGRLGVDQLVVGYQPGVLQARLIPREKALQRLHLLAWEG
ncbi:MULTISPECIES: DUF3234 domain-containing protein [unclassified Meiothermus]|uniref:DUF3234 domain-containing protein n=1 Tax=unclassified Meiothermus TaxID=370471 RepID=UPI000D7BA672|nr:MULTISPECIES: DUF3234 domain-containing protein [unclassified Meiothermus]PZA08229.1 DUF3234 domain-containing protein [Meiothermus sp. Pnk-1]RYM38971.1 DUF3234 domain-containing protein [Meiothermus sp. PNK-Is4]